MKVKNYNKGNYLSAFSCVVYGHIEMTMQEWKKAKAYLWRSLPSTSWEKNILKDDFDRVDKYLELHNPKRITWRNMRVTYTERLFKHYNLPRYKRQNYIIKIIK